jgi:regulator of sirC expression with transglutaminase-like and TPR domain
MSAPASPETSVQSPVLAIDAVAVAAGDGGGASSGGAASLPSRLDEIAAAADDAIDVAVGAALIAKDVYGSLDVAAMIRKLDLLAAPLVPLALAHQPAEVQAAKLGAHLFGTLGFRGNEKEYYDPRNSLLPDVLERRLGIPISLAVVYCEVARRAGVPAYGVGFPGHFLVRIERAGRGGEDALIVDPFYGGRVLDEGALKRMLERALGGDQAVKPEHLKAASSRAILVRMLTNLKALYLQRGDNARAHLALDRVVTLAPNAAGALRERGLVAAKLGANEAARADLARVLELEPHASDAASIRAQLLKLAVLTTKSPPN